MRNSQQTILKSYLALTQFFLVSCGLLAALLASPPLLICSTSPSQPGPPSQTSANPKVNLVSIVTDDQAVWSIGAYGNRESITPNMDRLAREGVKFNNALVTTPVCSPSRAAFLTG